MHILQALAVEIKYYGIQPYFVFHIQIYTLL